MTRQIRSRLAGLRLPQHTLAAMLGISQTKLNLILNEHRRPPAGFEAEATAALDRLERAEQAAAQGQSAGRCGVSGRREGNGAADGLPDVLFIDDVAALLRCSPSTIKRRLRARVRCRGSTSGPAGAKRAARVARGRRLGPGGAGAREADAVNAAAVRGGRATKRPAAAGWCMVEFEAGDRCSSARAAGRRSRRTGGSARTRRSGGGPAAGVGALRSLQSGAGVLMRAIKEGLAGAGRKGSAPEAEGGLPNSRICRNSQRGAGGPQPQFLHGHVGGGRQQDPQLVCPELGAARAVDLQAVEPFLDPVLDVAAPAVDLLLDEARRLAQIGHDEARVVPRLPAGELHDFGFDHHAALTSPRARAIAGVEVEVRRLLAQHALGAGRHHDVLGSPQQHGVPGYRHDVVEPRLSVEEIEDLRGGEAAVEPDEKARLGKRGPQRRGAADTARPACRRTPAPYRAAARPRTNTAPPHGRSSRRPAMAGSTRLL